MSRRAARDLPGHPAPCCGSIQSMEVKYDAGGSDTMNTQAKTWWSLSCLLLLICSQAEALYACIQQPQSVVDYYLLLPDKYLTEGGSRQSRLKAIKINDARNGYLRVEGAWEGYTEIALFRKPDRAALIAVSDVHFGPGPEQRLRFLEYTNSRWTDRTREVMPEVSASAIAAAYRAKKRPVDEDFGDDVPHLYLLPRMGTTITVVVAPGFTQRGMTLMELRWKDGRFRSVEAGGGRAFAGRWLFEDERISFDLDLTETGNVIKGTYSYVTSPNAKRIREGSLEGVVNGNRAEVSFETADYSQERGKATLTRSGNFLVWKITKFPEEESYLPARATLRKRK